MKKTALSALAAIFLAALIGCSQETQDVKIVGDYTDGRSNYDFDGKTFATKINVISGVFKREFTATSSVETIIPTIVETSTIVFGSNNSITKTTTRVYAAGADADYNTPVAGVSYTAYNWSDFLDDNYDEWNHTGYAGQVIRTEVFTGTYDKVTSLDNELLYAVKGVSNVTTVNHTIFGANSTTAPYPYVNTVAYTAADPATTTTTFNYETTSSYDVEFEYEVMVIDGIVAADIDLDNSGSETYYLQQ